MTATARALALAHTAALVWLVYCGAVSADHHAPGYAALFYVAAVIEGFAAWREYDHADQRRAEALRAERDALLRESAVADEITHGWTDLALVCCLTAWESHGDIHDLHTCTRSEPAA